MRPLWSDEVERRVRKEAVNLDPQTTPEKVVMCKRCVVTNQRPRIVFDEEGVCSACRHAERKQEIDWAERERELRHLLMSWQKKRAYDVVVPASGGKDSAFVATTLRDTYGMTPLCARFAPFMTTEIGERNWQSFIHAGFDTVTAQPNGLFHRKLARLAFEFYGDPFQPFVYGQLCYPMHVAKEHNVKLVFFGENGEAEYGGDPSAADKPHWDSRDWDRVYTKGADVQRLVDIGIGLGAITRDEWFRMSPYYRLPHEPPQFHWLGYYRPWHPQGSYYHAAQHTGFEAHEERSEGTYSKYASLDDKLDGLHYYMAYVKFGIGRCTSDAAHEVRDGDLTREEALALVEKYDGELPERYFRECMDYLGFEDMKEEFSTTDYFWEITERFRGAGVPADRAA